MERTLLVPAAKGSEVGEGGGTPPLSSPHRTPQVPRGAWARIQGASHMLLPLRMRASAHGSRTGSRPTTNTQGPRSATGTQVRWWGWSPLQQTNSGPFSVRKTRTKHSRAGLNNTWGGCAPPSKTHLSSGQVHETRVLLGRKRTQPSRQRSDFITRHGSEGRRQQQKEKEEGARHSGQSLPTALMGV